MIFYARDMFSTKSHSSLMMGPSVPTNEPVSSLMTLPTDLRCHIAYTTVSLACDIPTPHDLDTVFSLLLTCRLFYTELVMRHNPDLYANIFQLMFDVASVKRRLGSAAVKSSSMASELKDRVEVLKRMRTWFLPASNQFEEFEGHWDVMLSDFNRAVLIMIDDCGKNRRQIMAVAETAGVPELLASREITGDTTIRANLAMFVSLTELGRSEEELMKEGSGRRFMIMDLLQPFVLTESWRNMPNFETFQHCASITTVTYFGCRCRLRPPSTSLTLLARLCTVDRYKALRQTYRREHKGTFAASTMPIFDAKIDNDTSWYSIFDNEPLAEDKIGPLRSPGYKLCTFDGVWEGQLFITSVSSQNFTCALPMQAVLREFVSICAEDTVTVEGDADVDGQELARAWLPDRAKLEDNGSSVNIYDPVKGRWLTYLSASDVIKSSDVSQIPVIFDTILLGMTKPDHGEIYGDYIFHGRVRNRRRVALVRKPADPRRMDLGTWIFHGQIEVEREFIGDWRNASTEEYTAAQGWFQLSRISDKSMSRDVA